MLEHIVSVFKKIADTKDTSLFTKELSLEERKYFVELSDKDGGEEVFALLNEEYLEKLESIFEASDIKTITSEEAQEEVKDIGKFKGQKEEVKEQIIEALPTEELKMQYLDYVSEHSKVHIILKFQHEENRKKSLDKLELENSKAKVVASLENISDEERLEFLKKIKDFNNEYVVNIIVKLTDDGPKKEFMNLIQSRNLRNEIITSLTEPQNKMEALSLLTNVNDDFISKSIVYSFSDPEDRIKCLHYLTGKEIFIVDLIIELPTDDQKKRGLDIVNKSINDSKKVDIIKEITDPEIRIECLKYLHEDDCLKEIIINLPKEQQRIDNLHYISNSKDSSISDKIKAEIIATLPTLSNRIALLEQTGDDEAKATIVISLPEEQRVEHVGKISSDRIKVRVITTLKTDRLKLDASQTVTLPDCLLEIIKEMEHDEGKIELFKKIALLYPSRIMENVFEFEHDESYIKLVENIPKIINKIEVIKAITEKKPELLDEFDIFEKEQKENKEESREKKKIFITKFLSMEKTLQDVISDFISKNNGKLTIGQVEDITEIVKACENTNSSELEKLTDRLIVQILSTDHPLETFKKIEKIFTKKSIPTFGKTFLCFQILYPNFNKKGSFEFNYNDGNLSPELTEASQTRRMRALSLNATPTDVRFQIIFNDLLRISARSNNRSLKECISNIEKGNEIYLAIANKTKKYSELDDRSKEVLDIFVEQLEALYERTRKYDGETIDGINIEDKIEKLSKKFVSKSRYDLPDKIIRSFAYSAGISSMEELKTIMSESVRKRDEISRKRSEELSHGKPLTLEKGDFIRGIGKLDGFASILNEGNVCKEFLGTILGTSDSDMTPLDIDFSLITGDGQSIYDCFSTSRTGADFGYGNIAVVIKKDNPNINITRINNNEPTGRQYDPTKMEMFTTLDPKHYGGRTGMASTDIDYIIYAPRGAKINHDKPYNDDGSINFIEQKESNDLAIIKNEIAINGFYIPVVDFAGKILFTAEEYDMLRSKMAGLSYYGCNDYTMSPHSSSSMVDEIITMLDENEQVKNEQSPKIYSAIESAITDMVYDKETGQKMKCFDKIGRNIVPGSVEVLETGSSKRGTNVPGDFDFDYIFRVDAAIENGRKGEVNKALADKLHMEGIPSDDIRDKTAKIPGVGDVQIDVTYVKKNDKVEYSTEMALEDRLETIKRIDPKMQREIRANIILAKLLFKQEGCYKNQFKDSLQGGLGGVGIENWILQNGGSLESAARSFLAASEGRTFEEFKKVYHVHDYGKNHMYKRKAIYPHDDFVYNNMNSTGYEKIKESLRKYLLYLQGDKTILSDLESKIQDLKPQQEKQEETFKIL